jgi:hypothetical protein
MAITLPRPTVALGAARTGHRRRSSPARADEPALRAELGMSLGLRLRQRPVVAVPTAASCCEWKVSFTAVLVESGGVAGTIESVQAFVQPHPEGAPARREGACCAAPAVARPASQRVPARGAVEIALTLHYTLPGGAREAEVVVSVIVVGHDGYHYHVAERFPIV